MTHVLFTWAPEDAIPSDAECHTYIRLGADAAQLLESEGQRLQAVAEAEGKPIPGYVVVVVTPWAPA